MAAIDNPKLIAMVRILADVGPPSMMFETTTPPQARKTKNIVPTSETEENRRKEITLIYFRLYVDYLLYSIYYIILDLSLPNRTEKFNE
jgi:hypothetical protein